MRVLFIYPNEEGIKRVTIGIAILSSVLKSAGHQVKLFDASLYSHDVDNAFREKLGIVKPISDEERYWDRVCDNPMETDLAEMLKAFCPELIAFSIVENNWALSEKLLKICKQKSRAKTVVGGVFPTLAAEIVLANDDVDIMCFGEGEDALSELVMSLELGKDIKSIPNLWVKDDGKLYRNWQRELKDMDEIPFQDWDIFDERCLFRPFISKIRKTGFIEMSRGCPYNCTYCCEEGLRNICFKNLGRRKWTREKSVERCIDEVEYLKRKHALEMIFFVDETFLFMGIERLKRFGESWNKRIGLPYLIQTRPESLTEEKLKILKDSNCISISSGIETGDEEFRRKILSRQISNEKIIETFKLIKKFGIRNTSNVMIGFPYETEYHIQKSIELCKLAGVDSVALNIFAPYHGTLLHWVSERAGFIKEGYNPGISCYHGSILKMPQLSNDTIYHYFMNFKKYLDGDHRLGLLSERSGEKFDFSEFEKYVGELSNKEIAWSQCIGGR